MPEHSSQGALQENLAKEPQNLRALLRACALPRLEASLLWQEVLGVARAWLIAHDDEIPSAAQRAAWQKLVARRAAGEPMAYILGRREFYGREFMVGPAVLIPRPETELLVQAGLVALSELRAPLVLDLGTGSGAVAISLALQRPDARVSAFDCSPAALEIARANAQALGANVVFQQSNWYDTGSSLPRYHLIVSNPPYIAKNDQHLTQGDLRHEPFIALSDNADGLRALQAIAAGAAAHLLPGGVLCVEHGWDQAAQVRAMFVRAGLEQVASEPDLAGIERITIGRMPA